ncbi:MAG: heme o synthase [Hyphomicrobium sp.]
MTATELNTSGDLALEADPHLRDYVSLMKPRVMTLVVLTALAGLVLAPGPVHPLLALISILAISAGAGASGALNMWYDSDIDKNMARTAARPIPRGFLSTEDALQFGSILSVLSVLTLGVLVNWVAGALLALTIIYYIFIYTMWLKRKTPQNIVIGGAAGAFPPMIGWASVTGNVSFESILLFLIIFLWTPPHFWALALLRLRDYERVGIPMLPVVSGPEETRRQIFLYSVFLVPFAIVPFFLGMGGLFYGFASVVLGCIFLYLAFNVWYIKEGRAAEQACKRLFWFSILYLYALFAILVFEGLAARFMNS